MTCACEKKPENDLVWWEGTKIPRSELSDQQRAWLESHPESARGLGAEAPPPIATASASASGIGTGIVIGVALGLIVGGVVGVYLAGVTEDDNARRRQLIERRRAAGYAY